MNIVKALRLGIVVVVILVLASVLITYLDKANRNDDDSVLSEGVTCLSAICVVDLKYGTVCREFKSNMARVALSKDVNDIGANRLTVTFNSKQCN